MKKRLYELICGLCLIVMTCLTMLGMCKDVMITTQDRNAFVEGWDSFAALSTMHPFGVMEWIGGWMTQLFYWPVLGILLLLVIWLLTGFVLIKALKLKGAWQMIALLPLTCLLASELDLGYWVYILQLRGYWFAHSLAYLCVVLTLWGAKSTSERWRWGWYALPVICFPVFGWTAYLMTAVILLSHKPKIWDAIGVVLTVAAPLVWHSIAYGNLMMRDVWLAGFPFFENSTDESLIPSIPFFILIALTLLLVVLPAKEIKKTWLSIALAVVIAGISFIGVRNAIFKDYNYFAEMRMTQATMAGDWQSVLNEASTAQRPSRTMVILKNIALMNTGELGEKSFLMNGNSGLEICNPDSLNVNMMQIASPLVFYNYGCINYAIRWCIENAVEYGYSPFFLKILAQCADANDEDDVKSRYITILRHTMCYKDWTPKVTPLVKELKDTYKDAIGTDQNTCDRYLIEMLDSHLGTDSPVMQEQCLFYSMIVRDYDKFLPAFNEYISNHKGKEIPLHFQEALVLFKDLQEVELPSGMEISPAVEQNYHEFLREGQYYANYMDKSGVAEATRERWGGTYWWYNAFGREEY